MSELPSGPFGCILADPPWAFRAFDGRRLLPTMADVPGSLLRETAGQYYETTDTADLALIPVHEVAAADCALFMWVVDSHMEEALSLGASWGFRFKTCAFVWVKSKQGGWPRRGLGYWTRKQTEQCWLFTRGSPKRLARDVAQLIHCPRGAHSAKPDHQYSRIEALVAGPYLEMFARQSRPGWEAWGNEVGVRDGPLFDHEAA